MGGKGGYQGPSGTEIAAQKDAYRKQWDLEKEQDALAKAQDEENTKKKEVKEELKSRRGVKDVLSSSQIGFTKDDEEDESMLGTL